MARASFRRYAASNSSRPDSSRHWARRSLPGGISPGQTPIRSDRSPSSRRISPASIGMNANGALGKRIRVANTDDWREIVGVVQDVHDDGVDKAAPSSVYWPVMLDRFEGEKQTLQRSIAFVVRSPRAGSRSLHERGPGAGLVGQSRRAPGGRFHTGRALHEIHGANFLHPGDALRRGRHGSAAWDRGNLRSHLVFGLAAHPRDRHSHGARRAAGDADGDVCAPGIVAHPHRRGVRSGGCLCQPCA